MSAQLAYLGYGCNLSSAQQVLCKETIRMMPVILRVVTRLSFSDDADIQADCVEKVIVNVLPLDSVCIIFHTFIYEMQMTVRSSHGAYIIELFVKSTMQRQGMREICTYILSVVLHSCPSLRHSLISLVNEYEVMGHNIHVLLGGSAWAVMEE